MTGEQFVHRHSNYLWVVAIIADQMRPSYIDDDPYLCDLWRCSVWLGVTELVSVYRIEFWDIRWELVRGYALARCHRILTERLL